MSTEGKVQTKPEPQAPCSTPYTRAVENGGLNESPESFPRTPPSHQPHLLWVRSSHLSGSCHHAPLSSHTPFLILKL
jgi:hypothetical protein